jgi:uncharacterized protein (TIRG00374 family)
VTGKGQANVTDHGRMVRRPLDLLRFAIALGLTAAIVLLAYFATSTAAGLESDVTSGTSRLPAVLVLLINVTSGIGTLALPAAAGVLLIVRRRFRQLVDALIAALAAAVSLTLLSSLVATSDLPRLQTALAGTVNMSSALNGDTPATAPIVGALVAFITVARLMTVPVWNVVSGVVLGSVVVVTLLTSNLSVAAVGMSITLGWALGLIARYAFGTPSTRPSVVDVLAVLARGGLAVTELTADQQTTRGRRYLATTDGGVPLRITVLDRDREGAGLVSAIWRALRLRDEPGSGAFNMRRGVDHASLMSLAGQAAGAPVPELLLAAQVGPDSTVLAFRQVDGVTFDKVGNLSDEDLRATWQAVARLHAHQVSHRSLTASHLIRQSRGQVWLLRGESGAVAASDVAQRIDLAELLCTLALLVGPDRAIRTGQAVLGENGLARALPALQPVALSWSTRRAMRRNRDLMVQLRDGLVQSQPGGRVEQIQLERIRPRTLVMIVVGTIAGYVLLSQLADVDLPALIAQAQWWWLVIALALSLITYIGAAWSLSGFVPERLKLHRTVMAQVAGDFATLVSPPTLGAVAINIRFLQRAGLPAALAAASVGVSQVMAFVVHIALLLIFGVAAGTQADFTFAPPREAVIAVIAVALVALGLLAIPAIRRLLTKRLGPTLKEVGPRLTTVAQRPWKLVEGIGGAVLLNLAYIGVLAACIHAFDGQINLALVAVVYLTGATIGQAAPTPGGLGAVEAALAAGLVAAGLDSALAVSAVLLYRLVTFWLPTIPGYWAFTTLTKRGAL